MEGNEEMDLSCFRVINCSLWASIWASELVLLRWIGVIN